MATRAKTTKAKRTTKARKLPAAMAARAKAAREMTPAQKKAWVAKMAAAKAAKGTRKAKAKLSSWVVVKVGSDALQTFAAETEAEALEAALPDDGDALTIYRGVKAVDAAAARLPAAYNKAKDVTRGKWSER